MLIKNIFIVLETLRHVLLEPKLYQKKKKKAKKLVFHI